MKHAKDIAWKQIGFVGGALIVGMLAGAFIAAPRIEKWKKEKQAEKLAAKKQPVLKKTA